MTNRQAVGAPEPVTWIDAAGTRLAVMRRGRGTPVVCLHAIGHGARDFEALADRIGEDFEIVAIDWPGQGRSPPGIAPSAANYAALALAALDALGIERAVLIGNSIGGAAALRVAACHQDRVIALVLCNSGGLAEISAFVHFVIRRFVAFFRAGEEAKGWFGPAFDLYYRSVLPARPARAQRERIISSAYEIAGVLRQAWETFSQPDADLRNLVAQVECPVWIAWARSDRIIAWSRCKRSVRGFRNHTVTFFRGGHAAFLEDPDRFAKAFRKFMSRVEPDGAQPRACRKSQ
jgi:4,5:9,10-diseco-3-hydroxy-5,9,17-trioxoandrosta-1(10),2-diene-4-oate hydrolase